MLDYRKPELFVLGDAAALIHGVKTPTKTETNGDFRPMADSELDD
jgi:hypothetical protein